MKAFWIFLIILLVLPLTMATPDLDINKTPQADIVIAELDNPVVFDFSIINNGESEEFEVYSLVGARIEPKDSFVMGGNGSVSEFELSARLNSNLRQHRGLFVFDYEIQGENTGIFRDAIKVEILELEEVLEIEGREINLEDGSAEIIIRNKENALIEGVEVEVSSVFFRFKEVISLDPFGETAIVTSVDKGVYEGLEAGSYVVVASFQGFEEKVEIEGIMNYLSSEKIERSENITGLFIQETRIEKKNVGNVPVVASISVKRDVLTRLFTSYSETPSLAEREGLSVRYDWEGEIRPGESFVIVQKTNYTFPFILLLVVIAIVLWSRRHFNRDEVVLEKGVSYVKTKGGEFALKVRLSVRAKRDVTNLEISDKIPGSTKLYEKFGVKPDRIDEKTRRLFWKIQRLNAGEERVFSYIIYSKIAFVGRFELDPGVVAYNVGDEMKLVRSNHAYFVADTTSLDD